MSTLSKECRVVISDCIFSQGNLTELKYIFTLNRSFFAMKLGGFPSYYTPPPSTKLSELCMDRESIPTNFHFEIIVMKKKKLKDK